MKTLLLACFLTLTGLAHTPPRHAPTPLWERVINSAPAPKPGQTAGISMLAVTLQCLIVSGGPGPGGLQALDAQTGKTLWQRKGHWQRTRDDDQEAGKGDSWDVVGVARGSDKETVCLLKHTEQERTLNATASTFGVPKHLLSALYTLEAVSARTGQALWQSMAYSDKPECWFNLHNGVLTITTAGKGYEMRREYQDTLTGKTLALDTPEGRAQMRQILARNGGSILETQTTFQASANASPNWPLRWLRADTGTVDTLSVPPLSGYIHADLIQPLTPQGRVVLRIDEDNDAVGHSQMPKYLVGTDMQGHKLWQFPPQIKWRKGFEGEVAETQILPPTPIPGTGICLVRNGDLYGLRVRDGKPLWKRADFPLTLTGEWFNGAYTQPAATYRGGCFAFAPRFGVKDNDTPSVAYVSALTGSIQPLLFGVRVDQIRVSGDTLIVQTAGNTVRAYSIPALLAASPLLSLKPKMKGALSYPQLPQ